MLQYCTITICISTICYRFYNKKHGTMPFYEYYFEPVGKMECSSLMHEDYKLGMKAKII